MRGETRREEEEEERIFDIKPWWMVVLAFNQMRDTLVDERQRKLDDKSKSAGIVDLETVKLVEFCNSLSLSLSRLRESRKLAFFQNSNYIDSNDFLISNRITSC